MKQTARLQWIRRPAQLCLLVLVGFLWVGSTSAQPSMEDAYWDDQFGLRGASGPITALALSEEGEIIAAGTFYNQITERTQQTVAKWYQGDWSRVGTILIGGVDAITVSEAGTIYVSGDNPQSDLYRWDGNEWTSMLTTLQPPDESIVALAVDADENLYAAGSFTTVDWVHIEGVGRWDGTNWTLVGTEIPTGQIRALAVEPDGTVYVGGSSLPASDASEHGLLMLDGNSWTPVGLSPNSGVHELVLDREGNLLGRGFFYDEDEELIGQVSRWDGIEWIGIANSIGSDIYSTLNAMTVDDDGSVYLGGAFDSVNGVNAVNVAKWDGEVWSSLDTSMDGPVRALVSDGAGHLVVGGSFVVAGGQAMNRIARWENGTWSAFGDGLGMNGFVSALASDANGGIYVGGGFSTAGAVGAHSFAYWDGRSWSEVGSGFTGSVNAIAVAEDGAVYVGGGFLRLNGVLLGRVARWNGNTWVGLGDGMDDAVRALALDEEGNLYVGGDFSEAGGVEANSIAMWNGEAWTPLGEGMGGLYNDVQAIAISPDGQVYAGGAFTTAGSLPAEHIARWDGSQWTPVGNGFPGSGPAHSPTTLVFDAYGNLYAGGYFTTAGEASVSNVARWDGTSWTEVGMGTDGIVEALTIDANGNLYASGGFSQAGGLEVNGIARWDGTEWLPLGVGLGGSLASGYALTTDSEGFLYVGGEIQEAGNNLSFYIGRYDLVGAGVLVGLSESPVAIPHEVGLELTEAYPNPAQRTVEVAVYTRTSQLVTVRAYDARGRYVGMLYKGRIAAGGSIPVRWETNDLPAGVYFIQAVGETGSTRQAITVVR